LVKAYESAVAPGISTLFFFHWNVIGAVPVAAIPKVTASPEQMVLLVG
jgi:hypothetical protein